MRFFTYTFRYCQFDIEYTTTQLRTIIRFVRSSPQRREAWISEVERTKRNTEDNSVALMLILDVKTRWSSTHQMLRKY